MKNAKLLHEQNEDLFACGNSEEKNNVDISFNLKMSLAAPYLGEVFEVKARHG